MAGKAGAIRAGRAFVELFADDSKLVRGLKRASRRLKAFGASVRNIGLKMAAIGAAGITPLLLSTKVFARMGDQIAKMAKRTGLSVEALSELKFVASQTGTSVEALETGIRRMQRSIYDASRGLSTQIDALTDLGLVYKDLKGLAPEKQFKILAEAMSRIEDPTRRAALAQAFFGRAGTQLLPMMADGAAGIEKLQKVARDFGLTMSGEDAKAAEEFTDALDLLWKVVKRGIFAVGAALAPAIQQLAKTITKVIVPINAWIDKNRQVLVTVLKVAAAVLAGGLALTVLGTGIIGLGIALGSLGVILATASSALGFMLSAISLLITPIGAVSAALAALGVTLLVTTGAGAKALAWLGDRFKALKDWAVESWTGIADALAAGDIALAGKILWLTLKLEWMRGINVLEEAWLKFGNFLIKSGGDIWSAILSANSQMWLGLKRIQIHGTSFILKNWAQLGVGVQKIWAGVARGLSFSANHIKSLFDDAFDLENAERSAQTLFKLRLDEIAEEASESLTKTEAKKLDDLTKAAQEHVADLVIIGTEDLEKNRELASEFNKRVAENKAELAATKKKLREAILGARAGLMGPPAPEDGPAGQGAKGFLNELRNIVAGLGDQLDTARGKVVGTFTASDLLGRQLGKEGSLQIAAADRTTAAINKMHNTVKNKTQTFP